MRERQVVRNVSSEEIIFTVAATGESFTATLSELPEESIRMLVARAVNLSVGDSAVSAGQTRFEHMQQVWENLKAGIFTVRTPGRPTEPTNFIKALMKVYGKGLEETLSAVAQLSEEEVAEYRADATVKAVIKSIRADKARVSAKAANKAAQRSESTLTL